MTYAGLQGVHSSSAPHLGGNVSIGDPMTYSPASWDYLIQRFCIRSVLDLGCGIGNASNYFHRKGIATVAVDGMIDNISSAIHPIVRIDLSLQPVHTNVDLVHCQEVVEHIKEEHVGNLIQSFQSGKYVCMTHAFPGQGGHHHVNEQPSEYWIDLMTSNGFILLQEDTKRVREHAAADGAVYLQQSGLIFHNNAK